MTELGDFLAKGDKLTVHGMQRLQHRLLQAFLLVGCRWLHIIWQMLGLAVASDQLSHFQNAGPIPSEPA